MKGKRSIKHSTMSRVVVLPSTQTTALSRSYNPANSPLAIATPLICPSPLRLLAQSSVTGILDAIAPRPRECHQWN